MCALPEIAKDPVSAFCLREEPFIVVVRPVIAPVVRVFLPDLDITTIFSSGSSPLNPKRYWYSCLG